MALFRRNRADDGVDAVALAMEIEMVERVLSQYPPGTRISFGAPTRCPVCADFGLVENVEPSGRSYNRCLRCGMTWELTARAVQAQRRQRSIPRHAVVPPMTTTGSARSRHSDRPELSVPPKTGLLFSKARTGDVTRQIVDVSSERLLPRALPDPVIVPGRLAARDVPMKVLLVEDNPDDIEVVRAILEPAGPAVIDLRTARTRAAGEAVARSSRPDLVLLDLGLPDSHGMSTVTQWNDHVRDAPVLVVSGDYGRELLDRGREFGLAGVVDKADLVRFLELGDAGTTAFLDQLTTAAAG